MSARRWCISSVMDRPGDIALVSLHTADDTDLCDFIRSRIGAPGVLAVTIFCDKSKAEVMEHLRRQPNAIEIGASETVQ